MFSKIILSDLLLYPINAKTAAYIPCKNNINYKLFWFIYPIVQTISISATSFVYPVKLYEKIYAIFSILTFDPTVHSDCKLCPFRSKQ